jgi:hypothetical protein
VAWNWLSPQIVTIKWGVERLGVNYTAGKSFLRIRQRKFENRLLGPTRHSPQSAICCDLRLSALHLRSVCVPVVAFHSLRCHPWPCMSLKLRFVMDSIPSALTIVFNNLRGQIRATDSPSGDLNSWLRTPTISSVWSFGQECFRDFSWHVLGHRSKEEDPIQNRFEYLVPRPGLKTPITSILSCHP